MKIFVDEKPKNCFECIFSHSYGYDRYCKITHYLFEREEVKQFVDKKTPQPFISYNCGDAYENCPLIEQKECIGQKKGVWISTPGFDACSVCGALESGQTKFCPHCGARLIMRGERE